MQLVESKTANNQLLSIYKDLYDHDTTDCINGRSGADVVEGPAKFLTSEWWVMARVCVAVCVAVASLIANRCLLLDTINRQLTDVTGIQDRTCCTGVVSRAIIPCNTLQ